MVLVISIEYHTSSEFWIIYVELPSTWNIKYASPAQSLRLFGGVFLGNLSSEKLTSLFLSSWIENFSSSAATLSKTNDTNCLMVAPAVLIVVESLAKWSLKQSTKF